MDWFEQRIIETGRLPLFCFFVAMVLAFGFIRISVRLIRAEVRWWPGNVTPGGLHIHHVVFGVVFMLVGGVASLAIPHELLGARSIAAGVFGTGAALVLDEFALILHLKDVYWTETGRTSIDAVFVAIALSGLLLIGIRPIGVEDFSTFESDPLIPHPLWWGLAFTVLNLCLAVITLLKGKIWSGLLGLFLWPLIYIGAIRLARPGSPWARWRYRPEKRRGQRKLARATWREIRIRRPIIRGKIWFQELIAGRHGQVSLHRWRPALLGPIQAVVTLIGSAKLLDNESAPISPWTTNFSDDLTDSSESLQPSRGETLTETSLCLT